nr:TOM1-like protein 8 [Ipomoea batatas]GME13351.1 TOM1-like protein 8 [Ipomoea batatas]
MLKSIQIHTLIVAGGENNSPSLVTNKALSDASRGTRVERHRRPAAAPATSGGVAFDSGGTDNLYYLSFSSPTPKLSLFLSLTTFEPFPEADDEGKGTTLSYKGAKIFQSAMLEMAEKGMNYAKKSRYRLGNWQGKDILKSIRKRIGNKNPKVQLLAFTELGEDVNFGN